MEEDLKVKATEFEDIEEVWLPHDVIKLRIDITVRMCTSMQ